MTDWAKAVNDWRVIPRVLVLSYYALFARSFFWVTDWFMNYDFTTISDPSVALAIAGFPVGILGVMTGVLAHLTNNYFRTGNGPGNGG